MKSYALELITHTLVKDGPLKAVALACRIGRGKLAGQCRLVYGLSAGELGRILDVEIPEYRIECRSSWADLEDSVRLELEKNRDLIFWDMKEFMNQGGNLWIGRLKGQVANLGGTRTGDRMNAYFFPLISNSVVFSHFVTFPAFRGQNLYSAMMVRILRTLAEQGVEQYFVDCADWNLPSIRGIERAGFQRIGHGWAGRSEKLLWCQTLKPCCI
jgi:RimJ/RimL family protein N-acetyltransferase